MSILCKIFFILVFAIISTFGASFDETEALTSVTTQESLCESPEEIKQIVRISEEDNKFYSPPSQFSLEQQPIPEPIICINQTAIMELSTSNILTITFRSNQTGSNYTLESEIGKKIHDYIKLLKIACILRDKDKSEYNYGGPVNCTPALPKNVLKILGIEAISGKTIITKDVAKQLNLYGCMLSFSFISQSSAYHAMGYSKTLRTSQEIDEDRRLERESINFFIRKMKYPPDRRMTSHSLHEGYALQRKNGKATIMSEF